MKRLKGLTGLLVVLLCVNTASAVTLSATKIGAIFTTTPVAETAFQALSQFRGQFTPVNLLVTAANIVLITKIGDGINALRVQMASPLPAAQSPAGWADSETPPASVAVTVSYNGNGGSFSTLAAACTSYNNTSWHYAPANAVGYCGQFDANSGTKVSDTAIHPTTGTGCPTGYTASSGACALSTPAAVQWPSDGMASVKPVNGVLTPNPRDPDTDGTQWNSPYTRTGTDTYNNPVYEKIAANPANGIDYRRDTQGVNASTGESVVQRDQYSTDANGHVTYTSSNIYNNSTISSVNTTQSTPTDTSSLAKDATLTATNTKLDSIVTKLNATQTMPAQPSGPRTISDSNNLIKAAFLARLPSVVFSDVVPNCPVFSSYIPFLNFTMTIDQFCTMDSLIRPILNLISVFSFMLFGMFVIFRA